MYSQDLLNLLTELLTVRICLFVLFFCDSSVLVYSFAGLNSVFGSQYLKIYHDDDKYCAAVVRPFLKRNLDIIRGTYNTELMLRTILTS